MNKRLFALAGAIILLSVPASALPTPTPISTINGLYGVNSYDTPELTISNTTLFNFTNVVLKLTGYQGENNGIVNSQGLSDIAAGTTYDYFWGQNPTGPLFAGDYDDTGGNSQAGNPLCVQGFPYCAYVGNFYVTFTATWNGQQIYAQFSPDPTIPGAGNAAGVFVGWEGLDPNGLAETVYDDHTSGGPNGVLANIYQGTPPPVGGNVVPEPSSIILVGTGALSALACIRRRISIR